MQSHTSGEAGILGIGLIPGQSFQFLLKSVHIWQTRTKKISWFNFFLKHGVVAY